MIKRYKLALRIDNYFGLPPTLSECADGDWVKWEEVKKMIADARRNPDWCFGCNPDNCPGCATKEPIDDHIDKPFDNLYNVNLNVKGSDRDETT